MKKLLSSTCFAFVFLGALLTLNAQNAQGFGTVQDEEVTTLNGVFTVEGSKTTETVNIKDKTYMSNNVDECVLLIKDKAKAKILNSIFNKAKGNVTNGGQSNFYGLNAVVVTENGSTLTLKDVKITSSAEGANAVFSTGEGSTITIKNIKIHTTKNSSRGLDSTYGGVILADNVDITTEGEHCAAFATDRGEGTVTVNGGNANTSGEGSPVIYSTGNISVKNLTGKATGSELAVIEGKNSILIENSNLAGAGTQGVMLYQSMSGDANIGVSTFTSKDSTLQSSSNGPFFYITNTESVMNLENTKLISNSNTLIKCSGNNSERGWGQAGANGGTLTLNATKQNLKGNIVCDSISSIDLNLGKKSTYNGAINSSNEGTVNLTLSKNAKIILTGDCYLNKFIAEDMKFSNIKTNGYKIYYNKNISENDYLNGRTISFADGGKIIGVTVNAKLSENKFTQQNKNQQRQNQNEMNYQDKNQQNRNPQDNNFTEKDSHNDFPMPNENNSMKPNKNNEKENKAPNKMPEMQTVKGTLKIFGTAPDTYVAIVTDDGKKYALQVMDRQDNRNDKNQKPNGNPPDKKRDGFGEQPPAPPSNENQPKEMMKPVEMKDLIALVNTRVTIKGFVMKNDGKMNMEKPSKDDNSQQYKEMQDKIFVVISCEKE